MSAEELSKLIARVALKDRAAFRELYNRSSGKLFAVILRILKSRADSEDALQTTFVRIWENAHRYLDGGYGPMGWMIAIARNHAIDIARSRKPMVGDDILDDLPTAAPGPEAQVMAAETRRQLADCLRELNKTRADAVCAAYIEGYSYQELAERHAVPLNTMRTWLRRSLVSIRECLER